MDALITLQEVTKIQSVLSEVVLEIRYRQDAIDFNALERKIINAILDLGEVINFKPEDLIC